MYYDYYHNTYLLKNIYRLYNTYLLKKKLANKYPEINF